MTLRANREALARIALVPRVLSGAAERDQRTCVAGVPIASPVILAPAGLARIAGREGDLAGVRASGRNGTIFVLSTMASHAIEEVAAAAAGPWWFQVYLWRQREAIAELVRRAAAAGCDGLVVTLDVPVNGSRERDVRNGFVLPPRLRPRSALDMLRHPRWLRTLAPPVTFRNFERAGFAAPSRTVGHARFINEVLANPGAGYDDLRWLRELWPGTLMVKGVLRAEDALTLVEAGVDGIVVSNHGGRQLDGAPAAIDALGPIVDAVGDRAEVLFDGGVRRGADVVRALALGAHACLIGRPWLYGLACCGEAGVARVLELLREEVDRTLALLGCGSIHELDRSFIGPPPSLGGVRAWRA